MIVSDRLYCLQRRLWCDKALMFCKERSIRLREGSEKILTNSIYIQCSINLIKIFASEFLTVVLHVMAANSFKFSWYSNVSTY